jgi:hypothetical protein
MRIQLFLKGRQIHASDFVVLENGNVHIEDVVGKTTVYTPGTFREYIDSIGSLVYAREWIYEWSSHADYSKLDRAARFLFMHGINIGPDSTGTIDEYDPDDDDIVTVIDADGNLVTGSTGEGEEPDVSQASAEGAPEPVKAEVPLPVTRPTVVGQETGCGVLLAEPHTNHPEAMEMALVGEPVNMCMHGNEVEHRAGMDVPTGVKRWGRPEVLTTGHAGLPRETLHGQTELGRKIQFGDAEPVHLPVPVLATSGKVSTEPTGVG